MNPLLFFSIVSLCADPVSAESNKANSLPRDLSQWLDRMTDCDHWGGEEPYDEKRAAEIKSAVDRLKCKDLELNERTLREKYKSKPEVLKKFDDAIKNVREIVS